MSNKKTLLLLLSAIACSLPIWSGKYLPLTDLPQHVAQLAILSNFRTPPFLFNRWFELHLFTPYSLYFIAGRVLTLVFSPMVAVKVLLSINTLLLPVSFHVLLSETKGPRIIALIGFPIIFGANFFWGHLPFLFSVPLVIFFWSLTLNFMEMPNKKNMLGLGLLSVALFFTHLMAYCYGLAIAGLLTALQSGSIKRKLAFLSVLLPSVGLGLFWLLSREITPQNISPISWSIGWYRLFELPQLIIGFDRYWQTNVALIFLLIGLFSIQKKISRDFWRWVPVTVTLAFCLFGPSSFFQTPLLIAQRFSVFLIPASLFIYRDIPKRNEARDWVSRLIIACTTVGLSLSLAQRFIQFNAEAKDFDVVLNKMKPNRCLLMFDRHIFNASHLFMPTLYFGAYYQIFKGGLFEFTFANFPHQIAGYKNNFDPLPIKYGYRWEKTDMSCGFDYYLIHSQENEVARLNPLAKKNMKTLVNQGPWWLFERVNFQSPAPDSKRQFSPP